MRTLIIAVVALVVGGVVGYYYAQGSVSELEARLSVAETELVQANERAGTMAADAEALNAEVEALQAELATRDALIEDQQATIAELEAAQQEPAPAEAE
jgi:uncharacterized protein HemX